MLRRRILQLALAAVAVGIPLVACREPTQLTLVITTDVPCPTVTANGVDVRVGAPQTVEDQPTSDVTTKTCNGTAVGSIVVVPSGADDERVGIEVTLGTGGTASADCRVSSSSGCIIARRTLGYVPHTSLVLPIHLSAKCIDVACAVGQTCVDGACRSSEVTPSQCSGGTCGPETLPPVDGGVVDAAPDAAKDAGVDAAVDAGADSGDAGKPTCAQICTGGTCVGDVCQLTSLPIDLSDTAGCIAADAQKQRVWWTSNRGAASQLEYVPRKGGAPITMATAVPSGVAAGVAALGGTVNAGIFDASPTYAKVYEFDTALNPGTRSVVSGTDRVNYVARGPNADVCWTLLSGALMCTTWATPLVFGGGGTIVAASKSYVGVTAPNGAALLIYNRTSPPGSPVVPAVQALSGLAANPANEVFYTFAGTQIMQFAVSTATLTPLITRTTSTYEASVMAYDTTTDSLFWTERQTDGSFNLVAATAAVNAPVRTLATKLPRQYCLAVDDESVYWLDGGTPKKKAK